MKRIKYLLCILLFVSLLIYFYLNYIYYLIPYNPLNNIGDNPYSCHFDLNNSDGVSTTKASDNLNNNTLIFKYFSDLNLKPLKKSTNTNREEIFEHKNDINFSYRFRFDPPTYYYIYINEIWLDNLSVLSIRSNKPGLHNGYYKIIDSKFDYKYVNDLITLSQD